MLISKLLVVLLLSCVYNLIFSEIINKNEVVKNIISLYKLNTIQVRINKNILTYSLFLKNPIL